MTEAITHALTSPSDNFTFAAFVRLCARLCPECSHMAYEPLSVTPRAVQTEGFERELGYMRDRLAELEAMTVGDARAKIVRIRDAEVASHEEDQRWRATALGRIRAMAMLAETWTPPSDDHAELKRRMLEEVRRAAEYVETVTTRASVPDPDDAIAWLDRERADQRDRVAARKDKLDKLLEQQKASVVWVDALNQSLDTAT